MSLGEMIRLRVHLAELVDAIAGDVRGTALPATRDCAIRRWRRLNVTEHGLKCWRGIISASFLSSEDLGGFERLLQHLNAAHNPRRHVVAERVDAFRLRAALIIS